MVSSNVQNASFSLLSVPGEHIFDEVVPVKSQVREIGVDFTYPATESKHRGFTYHFKGVSNDIRQKSSFLS